MHRPRAAITALLATMSLGVPSLAVYGCGASDAALDGTPLVELPELVLQEDLRLGSLDDPVVGFSSLGDMWVAPDGEIWVAERQADEIRVYGEQGDLLRTYGRSGEGPGEFQSIYEFGLVGDTLWVSDSGLHRTTLFSLDGAVLETVTARVQVPLGEDPVFPRPLTLTLFPHALRPDGRIDSEFIRFSYANLPDSIVTVPKVVFDRDGEVVDTAELIERRVSRTAETIELGSGSVAMVYPEPPAQDSGTSTLELEDGSFSIHWSALGGEGAGVMIATRTGPEGDTIFQKRLGYDPRPVTDRYLDSLATLRTRSGMGRSDSLRLFQAERAALSRPDHHRPIRAPTSVGGGLVWMRLDPDLPAVNRWLVYRDATRELAIVELPVADSFLRSSDGETVWLMERDEFRVPWLVRYRIDGAGGAPGSG